MATAISQPEFLGLLSLDTHEVYQTLVTSDMGLVAGIVKPLEHVCDTPAHFKRVRESMRRRSDALIKYEWK